MTKNAYIHIPFCVKKCNYCAFTSYNNLQRKKDYIDALLVEVNTNYQKEKLNTLYFGGGTPSLLSVEDVSKIISCFNFSENAEVTIEVNPNKLKFEYLSELRRLGINRLSIGAQTFNEQILREIGRLHSVDDIFLSVKNARKSGFKNISLDLIYGLPNQSLADFGISLKKVIEIGVEHISLYGLKIEEDTYFYKNPPQKLPDEDMQADMYLLAKNVLSEAGFSRYEISNFAKKGFESRHNLNYWNANTYYGFGCGAHGYENNIRYENEENLENYILNPLNKKHKYELTKQEKIEEQIFLGFRKTSGIDVNSLKEKFGYDFETCHDQTINKFLKTGHLIKTKQGYALTSTGFLLSNLILSEFLA